MNRAKQWIRWSGLVVTMLVACAAPSSAGPPSDTHAARKASTDAARTRKPAGASYDVSTLELTPQPAMAIRGKAAPAELEKALGSVIPRLVAHAFGSGLSVAGPPFVRYLVFSDQVVEFEAGLPVIKAGPGTDDIVAVELPAGPAATTVHVGPYQGLRKAHEALLRWTEQKGKKPAGPAWEVYLTNPVQEPDPAKWRTKVFLPLSR